MTQPAIALDPASQPDAPARHNNNVRLVAVDALQQPSYLKRAAELQRALLTTASKLGVTTEDMPALQQMCVDAVRSAVTYHR